MRGENVTIKVSVIRATIMVIIKSSRNRTSTSIYKELLLQLMSIIVHCLLFSLDILVCKLTHRKGIVAAKDTAMDASLTSCLSIFMHLLLMI